MAKTPAFDYEVRRRRNRVEVEISRHNWRAFVFGCLWLIACLAAAFESFEQSWGQTISGFLVIIPCLLLAILGAVIAVNSLRSRTLILSQSGLRLRSSFLGIGTSKSIDPGDVMDFGFVGPSHSRGPALRLELRTAEPRTKSIVLASGTTQEEVRAFLNDIAAQGFQLPR